MELDALLIPLTVLIPAFAALAMLAPTPTFDDRRTAWTFALLASVVTFLVSCYAAWRSMQEGVSLAGFIPWVPSFGLRFAYDLDAISMWLLLLATFLTPIVVLSAYRQGTEHPRQFYFWLLLAEAAMVGCFVASDVLFFFLCFEFTLVPLYFLIGIFGGHDRWAAARVFFVYTFAGSMLTFAGLMYVAWFNTTVAPGTYPESGAWSFAIATLTRAAQEMTFAEQGWVLAALLAGFAVKTPIWPFHTWLPLTYVESPTAGTVVLSAVLAKLGTYGLLRFAIPMCPEAVAYAAPLIATLAVVGIVYAALIAWVQRDAKKLVAYSSISHLGFCVLGLFALDPQNLGAVGGVLYMVNHGLATGALFICLGMLQERFHTLEMGDLSGVGRAMPTWAFFLVFFAMASVGLPGLNGFVSEFLTLLGPFVSDTLGPAYSAVAGFALIAGAIYLLYMVGKLAFGPLKLPHEARDAGRLDLNLREVATLTPLALACLVLGLYPLPVLNSLEEPVRGLTLAAQIAAADDTLTAAPPAAPDSPAAAAPEPTHAITPAAGPIARAARP